MFSVSASEVVHFFKWVFGIKKHKVDQVYLKDRNLFAIMKNGQERQLTFSSTDSEFVFSKMSGVVVFIRSEEKDNYFAHKLMFFDTIRFEEGLIIDQKPQRDSLDGRFEILDLRDLKLTPNQKEVYFIIEKYVTGSLLVKMDIVSKQLTELFSVEKYEFIPSGKHKGKLLVGVSTIKDRGRDVYYEIRDANGEKVKEFSSYDQYREYRGTVIWNK